MMTFNMVLAIILLLTIDAKGTEATLTSNIFVACPDDTLTFTCTVSSAVEVTITWTVTPPPAPGRNVPPATVSVSNAFRTATTGSDGFMFLADYSGLIGGMISSTLTTRSTVTALAGAMVECVAIGGTEEGDGGGPLTIRVADPPSPPLFSSLFSHESQLNSSIVTLDWDPPSSAGSVSISYVLIISPTPLSGSPVTVETTSAQITISYNTPYNVTIRAFNCAGMSNVSILTIPSIVTCSSSPSTASRVVNVQTPSMPIVIGSKLNFSCSGDNQIRTSTCGNDGQWNPDPEQVLCPTVEPSVTCPVPGAPSNGSVSTSGQSYTERSQVTYQCNDGLFPMDILSATCTRDGVWVPDPMTVICRIAPVNCTLPAEPSNGTIEDYEKLNKIALEGTVLTYQCDNGLSLTGPNTITCTNAGVWSTEPEAIVCIESSVSTTIPLSSTGVSIAISVVISSFLSVVIGFLTGLLVMHLCSRKKAVYSPTAGEQANVRPTARLAPVYEEVSPKEEIELKTNQAYGPVRL